MSNLTNQTLTNGSAGAGAGGYQSPAVATALDRLKPVVVEALGDTDYRAMNRAGLAQKLGQIVPPALSALNISLDLNDRRALVGHLIEWLQNYTPETNGTHEVEDSDSETNAQAEKLTAWMSDSAGTEGSERPASNTVTEAANKVRNLLYERLDMSVAHNLNREELNAQLGDLVSDILGELKIRLNGREKAQLTQILVDDMRGLGPIEPLLADDSVTDIMVNGPDSVYVERAGKLERTDIQFRDNAHVMNVARRIVTKIGRRIDESSPLCDARLEDGSRVNVIAPPLAIDGTSISIRKFAKKKITLEVMEKQSNLSRAMGTVLRVAARSRLNVLISGGTGSGKTTLLNALSQMIDPSERIVTIEDAAELQLQQPHVVRLETRPANLEGTGEVNMRDLVKNALRMRPDRIILGEVRGGEALDMLQAMNTGHEGSLGTIHANRPREALTRLENMIGMTGIQLPPQAVRTQIAAAIDLIVQVSRMRDGKRRIVSITEVTGMEGDVITTQDLFSYVFEGEESDGSLRGEFKSSGLRPNFLPKAAYFSLDRVLLEATT